ncbi:hypothetical protein MKEN_00964100 [Mycena kentingensis (nom. inval.)]|nr:hypothetical protein MKEN_00964100 [Mycena kentingensis (nom. inval.)]
MGPNEAAECLTPRPRRAGLGSTRHQVTALLAPSHIDEPHIPLPVPTSTTPQPSVVAAALRDHTAPFPGPLSDRNALGEWPTAPEGRTSRHRTYTDIPPIRASSLLSSCIYARLNAAAYHSPIIPDEHDRRKLHRRAPAKVPLTARARRRRPHCGGLWNNKRLPFTSAPPHNRALRQPDGCLLAHRGRRPLDGTGCSGDEPERGKPCWSGREVSLWTYAPAVPIPTPASASFPQYPTLLNPKRRRQPREPPLTVTAKYSKMLDPNAHRFGTAPNSRIIALDATRLDATRPRSCTPVPHAHGPLTLRLPLHLRPPAADGPEGALAAFGDDGRSAGATGGAAIRIRVRIRRQSRQMGRAELLALVRTARAFINTSSRLRFAHAHSPLTQLRLSLEIRTIAAPRKRGRGYPYAAVLHGMPWYALKLRDVDAASSYKVPRRGRRDLGGADDGTCTPEPVPTRSLKFKLKTHSRSLPLETAASPEESRSRPITYIKLRPSSIFAQPQLEKS